MARGKSGRIVLEIDPEIKRQLYLALEFRQKTLKNWFLEQAKRCINSTSQPDLFEENAAKHSEYSLDNKEGS